jgi:hypothetical protein
VATSNIDVVIIYINPELARAYEGQRLTFDGITEVPDETYVALKIARAQLDRGKFHCVGCPRDDTSPPGEIVVEVSLDDDGDGECRVGCLCQSCAALPQDEKSALVAASLNCLTGVTRSRRPEALHS